MHRAKLVVGLGEKDAAGGAALAEDFHEAECVAGPSELQTHQQHQEEAEQQEAEGRHPILDADPFVVDGEDVLADEGLLVSSMTRVLFLLDAHRLAEKLLRVARVHPLFTDPELTFRCHGASD